jgi:hypothetical protein
MTESCLRSRMESSMQQQQPYSIDYILAEKTALECGFFAGCLREHMF